MEMEPRRIVSYRRYEKRESKGFSSEDEMRCFCCLDVDVDEGPRGVVFDFGKGNSHNSQHTSTGKVSRVERHNGCAERCGRINNKVGEEREGVI